MTELHAFRPVSTAFNKTRKLLLEPFDIGLWIKLVIITFFVGSGSGAFNPGNNLQYALNRADLDSFPYQDINDFLSDTTLITFILLIVLLLIALTLVMSYLRGVFSFVLIEALTMGNVRIIQSFKDNMHRGFKAFLFNIVTSLLTLAVIGGIIAILVLLILWAIGTDDVSSLAPAGILLLVIACLIGILFIIVFSILIGLIVGFFYDFAVPLIYFRGMGLRQSIRYVFELVKKEPLEFLVYVVVRWLMEIAVGIVMGIILLFVFAIFFAIGLLVMIAMIEAAKMSILFALPFALVLLVGLLLLVTIVTVISLPITVYFRYYSLDFLRSFDPSYVTYAPRFE